MRSEENFIVFADLKGLFLKVKWVVLVGGILLGAFGFWHRSQLPVKHEISALFKDGGKSGSVTFNGVLETMMQTIGVSRDSTQGHVLIASPLIFQPVIERLGLQASIQTEPRWQQKFSSLKKAWQAEKREPIAESPSFEFENVYYRGSVAKSCEIFFTTKETFEVRNNKKNSAKIGHLGESISFEDLSFTLKKIPLDIKINSSYPLNFTAMEEMLVSFQQSFAGKSGSLTHDAGILKLTLNYPDCYMGKRILNTVMEVYQDYLQEENRQITQAQLAYLEKRRDEFCAKMRESLQTHVAYLKENLYENGMLTLKEQLPALMERKKKFSDDLLAVELKLSKIGNPLSLGYEGEKLRGQLIQIGKERDELSLALLGRRSYDQEIGLHLKRLDNLSNEKLKIETGVDTFFIRLASPFKEKEQDISKLKEFGHFLSPDAHQLKKVQQEKRTLISLLKENNRPQLAKNFLADQVRLLSLQENVLMKRLFHGGTRSDEYRGVDLTSVRKLLLDYLHNRDNILCRIKQLRFAVNQLNQEGAESLSLESTFPDPLSQDLVRQIGETEKKLRRERTWTEKEKERFEKTLRILKEDLARHAEQSISLAYLEKERVEDRIVSLQLALLDLLGQEVSLVEKQLEERIHEELNYLQREKELVNMHLVGVKEEMALVPDAWLREQELKFNADMTQGMLEALVHLVESKNIESNLITIESKPLGLAHASLFPKAPHLKLFAFVGILIGALISFVCCLIYYFYRGFPLSLRNMEVRGKKVLGSLLHEISFVKGSKDLEVLRHFSLLVHEEKIITLVLGKGSNYSAALGELFHKEGKNVLLIALDFNREKSEEHLPGLLHFLTGEAHEPIIRKKEFGDYIPMGKATIFGDELLKSKKFNEFLERMKKEYDIILLALAAEAKDSLPKHFFSASDIMAISLRDASYSILLPYFLWEREGKTLAFLS